MRRLLFLFPILSLALALLQACAPRPEPQEGCNFVMNSEEQRVSWGDNTPVLMYIDSSVPTEFIGAVQAAADEWNRSLGRVVIKIGGIINQAGGPAQDGVNVIYWRKQWEAEKTNEQARTTIYWAGDRIFEADIKINAKDFNYFWSSGSSGSKVDLESLLVHEMGHVLGLTHADVPESVMVRTLPNGITDRRQPKKFDVDSIRCEY